MRHQKTATTLYAYWSSRKWLKSARAAAPHTMKWPFKCAHAYHDADGNDPNQFPCAAYVVGNLAGNTTKTTYELSALGSALIYLRASSPNAHGAYDLLIYR